MSAEKYIIKDSFGLDNLVRVPAAEPAPGPGQVAVRIKAVSLNFRDLLTVKGLYNPNLPLPLTPCSDGVGEVEAVGEGVTKFSAGDRVCSCFFQGWEKGEPTAEEFKTTLGGPLDGTLTQRMLVSEGGVVKAPEGLTDEQAATLPCAAVTAYTALSSLGKVKAGDTVLTQGTGGVSIFALQLARAFGARVISTTSSDEKAGRLLELGAESVINYKEEPKWGKKVRDLTDGRGVDHVIEVGGAGTLEQSLIAARTRGRVSVIGVLSGIDVSFNLRFIIMNSLAVQGIFVGPRQSFQDLNRAIEATGLRPVVDRVFPFEEAAEAMRYLQSGAHLGKVVIRVS